MDSLDNLAKLFARFPGIGERQSRRFVYFLLAADEQYRSSLAKQITSLRAHIVQCPSCYVYFEGAPKSMCSVCANPKVNLKSLLVIEKDADYLSVKKTKLFDGRMFLFGGLVPIVEKDTRSNIRIDELISTIKNRATSEGLEEVVLGFSLTPQGAHTDQYVREQLAKAWADSPVRISSLGRGLSTGTEIEYSDSETLKSALQNRK